MALFKRRFGKKKDNTDGDEGNAAAQTNYPDDDSETVIENDDELYEDIMEGYIDDAQKLDFIITREVISKECDGIGQ